MRLRGYAFTRLCLVLARWFWCPHYGPHWSFMAWTCLEWFGMLLLGQISLLNPQGFHVDAGSPVVPGLPPTTVIQWLLGMGRVSWVWAVHDPVKCQRIWANPAVMSVGWVTKKVAAIASQGWCRRTYSDRFAKAALCQYCCDSIPCTVTSPTAGMWSTAPFFDWYV